MITLGAYLAEAMQTGGERYSMSVMDMGNTSELIDVRLLLAQGKRLDRVADAVQREQSGMTHVRTNNEFSTTRAIYHLLY